MSERDSNPKAGGDSDAPDVDAVSTTPVPPRPVGAFPPPPASRLGRSPVVPVTEAPPLAETAPPRPLAETAPPRPLAETAPPIPLAETAPPIPLAETAPPAVESTGDAELEPFPVIAALESLFAVEALMFDETPLADEPAAAAESRLGVDGDGATAATVQPRVAVHSPRPVDPPPVVATTFASTGEVVTSAVTSRVVVLLMAASLVMVLFHLQIGSRENANTGSRYATIESLVDYGTWNIDASHYVFTPDKVKARGHFVSSKPPLLPTYGAGVYFLLKKITGYNIGDNEGIVVWTVSLFTGWLSHLVFLVYFYRLCRFLLVRQLAIIGTMAAACFAYLGVAYGTAINNHSPGAALAVVGFYYAFRARNDLSGRSAYLLAGFWLGVLPAIDLSSAAVTAFSAIYLATRNFKRTLLLYIPATLPGIASQILLAHDATGSWIPAYADTGLMHYAGSYFGGRRAGIDALFEPKSTYAFNVLLGHHGLFSMTPIFFFSLFELVRRLARRDKWRAETVVFSTTVVVVCAFYIFRTHNYGGWCVGMRWLVPIMPWLLVAFGLWLDRATLGTVKWGLVVAAFAVSAFNAQDGLTSPFQFSLWHNFLDGEPNRNRLGPKWNLSHPSSPPPRHTRPPPRGKPRPAKP